MEGTTESMPLKACAGGPTARGDTFSESKQTTGRHTAEGHDEGPHPGPRTQWP